MAAPELLEALKRIVDNIGMTPESENAEMKIIAKQAITKAEGK